MSRKANPTRVTLARVAKESSVSVTTASLILSGKPESLTQFQSETVERVRESARKLGYGANLFASSLLAGKPSFFALVLRGGQTIDEESWRYNAYESELLCGITEGSVSEEAYPIVVMADENAGKAKVASIERVMAGGVRGTIVRTPNRLLEACIRNRVGRDHPVVVVFPNDLAEWPQNAVDVDNVAIGEVAAKLLAARKARKWLLVKDEMYQAGQALRQQGCERIAGEMGIEHHRVTLPPAMDMDRVNKLLVKQIRRIRPDGIFAMTLHAASGSLNACEELGIKTGSEVAMVGCDCAFWRHSSQPSITSIDVSWTQAGIAAVRQLERLMDSGESRFDTLLLKPRIVEGSTCSVPPGLLD